MTNDELEAVRARVSEYVVAEPERAWLNARGYHNRVVATLADDAIALLDEVERLDGVWRSAHDEIVALTCAKAEAEARATRAEAHAKRLVGALEALTVAADGIKHWHDAMSDSSGMVVSAEHVRTLWHERDQARQALSAYRREMKDG